jgi:hypothetical protein
MKIQLFLFAGLAAGLSMSPAYSKLPAPTDEAKAEAAETTAKAAWADKVGLYQTCLAQDRVADAYRKTVQASGGIVISPTSTPPCVNPGPYVSTLTPVANKPLEASEAHSPPGLAVSPPSTKSTAAEIAGGIKKPVPN